MSEPRYRSEATTTRLYISIPDGKRIRGRVKEVDGTEAAPEQVHPGKPHRWHEMLHYGQSGTGFAQCICGAVGVPFLDRHYSLLDVRFSLRQAIATAIVTPLVLAGLLVFIWVYVAVGTPG